MTRHDLKIAPAYYDAVASGIKTFEVRRDDRPFRVGDLLVLHEWAEGKATRRPMLRRTVAYILRHDDFPDGIPEGFAVLGIKGAGA